MHTEPMAAMHSSLRRDICFAPFLSHSQNDSEKKREIIKKLLFSVFPYCFKMIKKENLKIFKFSYTSLTTVIWIALLLFPCLALCLSLTVSLTLVSSVGVTLCHLGEICWEKCVVVFLPMSIPSSIWRLFSLHIHVSNIILPSISPLPYCLPTVSSIQRP